MDLHPDFRDLLAEFVREKVEFVLIGGYAVGRYTKPRATKDLDLSEPSTRPGGLGAAREGARLTTEKNYATST